MIPLHPQHDDLTVVQIDENPVLTALWLDLMVLYVRLHYLSSTVPDRKLVLLFSTIPHLFFLLPLNWIFTCSP